jgi:hypothetical protein
MSEFASTTRWCQAVRGPPAHQSADALPVPHADHCSTGRWSCLLQLGVVDVQQLPEHAARAAAELEDALARP